MIKPRTTHLEGGRWAATLGNITEYGTTEAKARKACEATALAALTCVNRMPAYIAGADGRTTFVVHVGYANDGRVGYGYDIVRDGRICCAVGTGDTFDDAKIRATEHAADYYPVEAAS